jgi:hypothetical protein
MAAVAGGLLVYQQHSVQPASFSAEQSVGVFLIVVIGGLGSVVGPLLGSLYNGVILMLSSEPLLALLGQGVGVVAILILYPGGLSAVAYALRDAWLRRVAIRYRIIVPSLLADTIKEGHEEQAVIAPKRRPGGGPAFVPVRYRMPRRWDRFTEKAG